MRKDDHLILEALQNRTFTIVSGGTDNGAEHGFDINPVKHIQASDLKSAVQQMITKMAEDPDAEPEDINQTFPKEFREFRKDHFVMSNDNGDWYYVFPGKLTDEQAYDRVLATGDYGSEDAENAEETAEQRIAAAKQAVAQAKGQIAQAKIQGQMKHYGDGLAKALGKSENAEGQPMTQQNKMPVTYIHLDLYTGKTSVIPQREFQQAIDGLEKVRGKMTVYKGEEYMVLVVPIPGTR